jgi:aspartyl/asparaginyl beta-hydroxylase (cupin superfamily)
MVAKLLAGGTIHPHVDAHPSFSVGHRIHVPLKTNDDVQFIVEGERIIMEEGEAYELNNLLNHGVHNGGKEDRIHLIFDYMDPL